MSVTANYESQLWKLLEANHLADLSQYHRRGFFDEVPLYSRQSEIDFLPDEGEEANEILLRFALKFLKSIVAYERHRSGFFAAITVWDFSDARIVPSVFVWCDAIRALRDRLPLKPVKTPFGKRIKKLLPRLKLGDPVDVLEETETVPGSTRVFLLLAQPPYQGYVTSGTFLGPVGASN